MDENLNNLLNLERMLQTIERITDLIVLMDANIKGITIKLNDLEERVEDLEAR
jgi:hypothetical protein